MYCCDFRDGSWTEDSFRRVCGQVFARALAFDGSCRRHRVFVVQMLLFCGLSVYDMLCEEGGLVDQRPISRVTRFRQREFGA